MRGAVVMLSGVEAILNTQYSMKEYYVYILKCADDSYYTGITNDLERRFQEHQKGLHENSFTYRRRPVRLVFVETFHKPEDAIAMEKRLKGWSRAKKEALIENNFGELKKLARCRNETHFKNMDQSSSDPTQSPFDSAQDD